MQYYTLGNTDIEISNLAFGTWALAGGGHWGEQDDRDAIAAIQTALDEGMTFIDTAEAYGSGKSETLLGKALKGKRDQAVIASKVGPHHFEPEDLKKSCEKSLKRLQTDYIDLYQLHWPNHSIPVEKTLEAMRDLKSEGKIRAIGVSNFGPRDMQKVFDTDTEIVTNQLAYNLVFRAIEYDILPICREKNIGVLAYSPLMQGVLTGKWEKPDDVPEDRARTRIYDSRRFENANHDEPGVENAVFDFLDTLKEVASELNESMAHVALAWVTNRDGVSSTIVGGRNPDQARRNTKAADLKIPQALTDKLDRESKDIKRKLGPNADMWQSDSRIA